MRSFGSIRYRWASPKARQIWRKKKSSWSHQRINKTGGRQKCRGEIAVWGYFPLEALMSPGKGIRAKERAKQLCLGRGTQLRVQKVIKTQNLLNSRMWCLLPTLRAAVPGCQATTRFADTGVAKKHAAHTTPVCVWVPHGQKLLSCSWWRITVCRRKTGLPLSREQRGGSPGAVRHTQSEQRNTHQSWNREGYSQTRHSAQPRLGGLLVSCKETFQAQGHVRGTVETHGFLNTKGGSTEWLWSRNRDKGDVSQPFISRNLSGQSWQNGLKNHDW